MDTLEKTIELPAWCLFSKWGFGDGDMLDDLVWDNNLHPQKWWFDGTFEDHPFGFAHCLLITLVERFLIPALPESVETFQVVSIHNPIRAHGESNPTLHAINVAVPVSTVLQIAAEMIREEAA